MQIPILACLPARSRYLEGPDIIHSVKAVAVMGRSGVGGDCQSSVLAFAEVHPQPVNAPVF